MTITTYSYRDKYEKASEQAKSFMGAWMEMERDYEALMAMLKEANDLLRSAHAIAEREGRETGWPTFRKRVSKVLKKQHKVLTDYYDQH